MSGCNDLLNTANMGSSLIKQTLCVKCTSVFVSTNGDDKEHKGH